MQAFYLARTGRPGPVLIDVPKDVQQQLAVPDWDVPMAIAGYMGRLPQPPTPKDVAPILQALKNVSDIIIIRFPFCRIPRFPLSCMSIKCFPTISEVPMLLPLYNDATQSAFEDQRRILSRVIELQAKKPVLYVGGGCLGASAELREFVRLTQIPVAQTLMGLGTYDATQPLALQADR